MFEDMFSRTKMNVELSEKEGELPPFGRAEKKALRQAEKAEQAFRESKGYAPTTLRQKLKKRFQRGI